MLRPAGQLQTGEHPLFGTLLANTSGRSTRAAMLETGAVLPPLARDAV